MVGGADVSLQYPGSLGIGKGPKKFRRGATSVWSCTNWRRHIDQGAECCIHSVNRGVTIDPIVGRMGISRRAIVFCRGDSTRVAALSAQSAVPRRHRSVVKEFWFGRSTAGLGPVQAQICSGGRAKC